MILSNAATAWLSSSPSSPTSRSRPSASDRGAAYKEFFGETFYTFDHKGVHFIAIDNVSDSGAKIGDEQLAWLRADLATRDKKAPIVVLTHRPLFDLAPKWDWATRDGAQAVEMLMPFANVTVFYGHIHQEHHHMTGHIAHHSAKSLIFPLPAPGSQPNRTPLPWDASSPYKGLGFREVEAEGVGTRLQGHRIPNRSRMSKVNRRHVLQGALAAAGASTRGRGPCACRQRRVITASSGTRFRRSAPVRRQRGQAFSGSRWGERPRSGAGCA
jgi:hypothetical protein